MNPKTLVLTALLLTVSLAGCTDLFGDDGFDRPLSELDFAVPADLSGDVSVDDITWPDLTGATLRILDHGAFAAFETAAGMFTNLTGATVEHTEADDTGSALERAVLDKGDPQFDVLYGIDNILLWQALQEDLFQAYTPQLAERVQDDYVFFDGDWYATPVDHGYIALNVDPRHDDLDNVTVEDLYDVRAHADTFVTQDPRTSTPGLGFLLVTLGVFGDDDAYDYLDYWTDLFENDVLVTSGWSEAYEIHFSGGYGIWVDGHQGDRAIVTSYTESPAYEAFWGAETLADVLLTHRGQGASFHQIQTMAILDGAPNQAAAEAWIEFTLTDEFQDLAAAENAVYPVVDRSTDDVYGDVDPEPGTFPTIELDWQYIGQNLESWVNDWVDLCEAHDCV